MDSLRKNNVTDAIVSDELMPSRTPSLDVASNSSPHSEPLGQVDFKATPYTQYIKPAGDRVAALCAVLILAVPILLTAAAVALSLGRPIFFSQSRVGLNGKVFKVFKFRTMGMDRRQNKVSVSSDLRVTHKSDEDPRHTSVGRILRSLSLDELPQLFNIVRGEMSVVGPRPELESVVTHKKYPEMLHQRHLVKPGLTGMWQISARGDGAMHENGEWDLEYVEKISFWTDVKIVCKTPFAMFGGNRGH